MAELAAEAKNYQASEKVVDRNLGNLKKIETDLGRSDNSLAETSLEADIASLSLRRHQKRWEDELQGIERHNLMKGLPHDTSISSRRYDSSRDYQRYVSLCPFDFWVLTMRVGRHMTSRVHPAILALYMAPIYQAHTPPPLAPTHRILLLWMTRSQRKNCYGNMRNGWVICRCRLLVVGEEDIRSPVLAITWF